MGTTCGLLTPRITLARTTRASQQFGSAVFVKKSMAAVAEGFLVGRTESGLSRAVEQAVQRSSASCVAKWFRKTATCFACSTEPGAIFVQIAPLVLSVLCRCAGLRRTELGLWWSDSFFCPFS